MKTIQIIFKDDNTYEITTRLADGWTSVELVQAWDKLTGMVVSHVKRVAQTQEQIERWRDTSIRRYAAIWEGYGVDTLAGGNKD